MSLENTTKVNCPFCHAEQNLTYYSSVNVTISPDLKAKVISGKLNESLCSNCHKEISIMSGFLYHDMANRIMINFTASENSEPKDEELLNKLKMEGYIYRDVFSYPELVQKIKIFDGKLNDIVIDSIANKLKNMLNKSVKSIEDINDSIEFKVFFNKVEKGLFKKELSYYCFTHHSQMMELKYKFSKLSAAEKHDLYDLEKLRITM